MHKRQGHCGRAEQGNILFLILLAVILFAALSYAVTSSLRGGGKDSGEETMQVTIASYLQFATLVENTITRLKLTNNCSNEQISFKNNAVVTYDAHVAPAKCEVFNKEGGGLGWPQFKDQAHFNPQPFFMGNNYVEGVGTGEAELVMIYGVLQESTCIAINNNIGVPNPNGAPPIDTDISTGTPFTGTYALTAQLYDQTTGGVLRSRMAGCFYETVGGANTYKYYQVLIAR